MIQIRNYCYRTSETVYIYCIYLYYVYIKGTISFRRCSEKCTIYFSEPKQRETYNKKIRFIFRSQNP